MFFIFIFIRPVTRGKGKSRAKPTFVLEAHEEDQNEKAKFSDDWDEKEMNIAFKKSKLVSYLNVCA